VKRDKNNLLYFLKISAIFFMLSFPSPAFVLSIQPDEYEADDTFKQAKVIVIENVTPRHHTFHNPEDADWVKFYGLSSVKKYSVEARNLGKDCDVRLEIYDRDGLSLLADLDTMGDTQAEEILQYSFNQDGIYYVKVIWSEPGTVGDDADTGYDLSIQIPDAPVDALFSYQGAAKDVVSQAPLGNVMIRTSENLFSALSENNSGGYVMYHPVSQSFSTAYTLTAGLSGYEIFTIPVFTSESCSGGKSCFKIFAVSGGTGQRTDPEIIEWDGVIELIPQGDITGDHKIDLADVISGLQVLTGTGKVRADYTKSGADVSGDNKVGMEEVIHILNILQNQVI